MQELCGLYLPGFGNPKEGCLHRTTLSQSRFHPWCLLPFPPLITRSFVAQGGDEAARRPLRSCTVCSRVPWRQGSWQTANLYLDGTWISAAV